MDKITKAFLIVTILFLVLLGSTVTASNIQFIDAAYIGNGTMVVSYPNNTPVAVLHSGEQQEINNNTGYVLVYQPAGFVQLNQESGTGWTFPTLQFLLSYFSDPVHLITALVLIFLLLVIVGSL